MYQENHALAASPAALLPGTVRARVWIDARCFFSRDNSQSCWLWLLRGDEGQRGQVVALRLLARLYRRDDLLERILAALDGDGKLRLQGSVEELSPLDDAPIVPVTRWAVSWGSPVWQDIRHFASLLKPGILVTLGRLEAAEGFYGSVGNYNRLAQLPVSVCHHRLQALERFPPLVAPLLVDELERPEMFNSRARDKTVMELCEADADAAVLDAMDQGRDLVGALADYWEVSRSLVKSPLLREPWGDALRTYNLLRLLDAVPAHARPTRLESLRSRSASLFCLVSLFDTPADAQRLGRLFRHGWEASWQPLEQEFAPLANHLRDCGDFIAAALQQSGDAHLPHWLKADRLMLGWLVQRGLASLLQASRRWHAQPLTDMGEADGLPARLVPVFGQWEQDGCVAVELTCAEALVVEGESMHHCVGSYWEACLLRPTRIVHLTLANGESATAQYDYAGDVHTFHFRLEELRGPCNADCSDAMNAFAQRLLADAINAEENQMQRFQAVTTARELDRSYTRAARLRHQRLLDQRSRAELRSVLDYCLAQADWRAEGQTLYQGAIAGFGYAEGPTLLCRLQAGDVLQLLREPANPHDLRAVRIDWKGHKLGYVPRRANAEIARQLDAGVPLQARIQHLWRDGAELQSVDCSIYLPVSVG